MTTKKTILIVEDDDSLREALRDKFSKEGFYIVECSNGEDGLRMALLNSPDMILLDIVMPKMDGLTMFQKLREDKRGKNIGVIMLTNLQDHDSIVRSMRNGVYDYLVKIDWTLNDVVRKVNEYLNGNKK